MTFSSGRSDSTPDFLVGTFRHCRKARCAKSLRAASLTATTRCRFQTPMVGSRSALGRFTRAPSGGGDLSEGKIELLPPRGERAGGRGAPEWFAPNRLELQRTTGLTV